MYISKLNIRSSPNTFTQLIVLRFLDTHLYIVLFCSMNSPPYYNISRKKNLVELSLLYSKRYYLLGKASILLLIFKIVLVILSMVLLTKTFRIIMLHFNIPSISILAMFTEIQNNMG